MTRSAAAALDQPIGETRPFAEISRVGRGSGIIRRPVVTSAGPNPASPWGMTQPPDDAALAAHIDAAPALVGLAIAPEYRPGVALHLRAIANAATAVLALPLDGEAEPAPVFTP